MCITGEGHVGLTWSSLHHSASLWMAFRAPGPLLPVQLISSVTFSFIPVPPHMSHGHTWDLGVRSEASDADASATAPPLGCPLPTCPWPSWDCQCRQMEMVWCEQLKPHGPSLQPRSCRYFVLGRIMSPEMPESQSPGPVNVSPCLAKGLSRWD